MNKVAPLFVIIDGSSLICSSYFGSLPDELKYASAKSLSSEEFDNKCNELLPKSSDGLFVNGIDIFMCTLCDIITTLEPDKIAVCFDEGRSETFRRAMYPEYKAQRGPTQSALRQQIKTIHSLVKDMGVECLSSKEYEADDYAGSLARKAEAEGYTVRLLTKDRDYFQLITDNTKVWWMVSGAQYDRLSLTCNTDVLQVPTGCVEFGVSDVVREIGIAPVQVAAWKGLSGDPSDNIPGVKGISDKTAIPLLKHYKTMEAIFESLGEPEEELKSKWKSLGITRPPIQILKDHVVDAAFFTELATIKCDLPVPDISVSYSHKPSLDKFEDISIEYNLSFLKEMVDNEREDRELYGL